MKYFLITLILIISSDAWAQVHGEGVVINEFMASNDMTAADPAGDFDDWIELYNTTDEAISLSGFFLSDKEDNLGKFEIPDSLNVVIAPLGYLIIWADEDGDKMQEGIHANFKLSGGGEAVILSNPDTVILDQIIYDEQTTDLSAARVPNGTGDFVIGEPTFGTTNDITSSNDELILDQSKMSIYPNPNEGVFELQIHDAQHNQNHIKLYNVLGKLVHSQSKVPKKSTIDISEHRSGIYVLVVNDKHTRKVVLSN